MAFSENDAGLTYFRRLYGKSFQRLKAMPGLSIKLLSTETHIPSHDEAAASALVSMVDRWAHDSGFATPPIIRDNERRDNQPHAMSSPVRPLEPVGG